MINMKIVLYQKINFGSAGFRLRYSILFSFGLCILGLNAQSPIELTSCDFTYIDPQDQNAANSNGRDTLIYRSYFGDSLQLRNFIIDINAFGGQQIDRTEVFAIMADSTRKSLGRLAFGNCFGCVDGFAFLYNDSLYAEGVTDPSIQELWINSFGQPAFAIQGSQQTLVGLGRISGQIPFCAVGFEVIYQVNSNPANATTEFSTHIICPEVIQDCAIDPTFDINCLDQLLLLNANVPSRCFALDAEIFWMDEQANRYDGDEVSLPLAQQAQWYFLHIQDDCCLYVDSVYIENPSFAVIDPQFQSCSGLALDLSANGGTTYDWITPNGSRLMGNPLQIHSATPADGGRYTVIVTNDEGCVDTIFTEVVINEPILPEANLSDVCYGDTLYLNVANDGAFSSIEWLKPSGLTIPNNLISNYQITDDGTYTILTTDTLGCNQSTTTAVNGSELPNLESIFESSCQEVSVTLLPAFYQYKWPDATMGNQRTFQFGGPIPVEVTANNGCTTINIVEVPDPGESWYDLVVEQPRCPGEFGAIIIEPSNPSKPLIYSIDGGANYTLQNEFTSLLPGAYPITIRDESGCIEEELIILEQPASLDVRINKSQIEARPNELIELKADIIGNPAIIQWLPESIDNGLPETSFNANRSMDVRVIVQDDNGCHAVARLQLTVLLSPIHAPNAFSPNLDGRNDGFTLYSDLKSGEIIESLLIYDRYGNQIYEGNDLPLNQPELGWDGRSEGQKMNPGVYAFLAIIRYGNGIKQQVKGDVALIR